MLKSSTPIQEKLERIHIYGPLSDSSIHPLCVKAEQCQMCWSEVSYTHTEASLLYPRTGILF